MHTTSPCTLLCIKCITSVGSFQNVGVVTVHSTLGLFHWVFLTEL